MLAVYIDVSNGQAVTQSIMDSGSAPQFQATNQIVTWTDVDVTHYNLVDPSNPPATPARTWPLIGMTTGEPNSSGPNTFPRSMLHVDFGVQNGVLSKPTFNSALMSQLNTVLFIQHVTFGPFVRILFVEKTMNSGVGSTSITTPMSGSSPVPLLLGVYGRFSSAPLTGI